MRYSDLVTSIRIVVVFLFALIVSLWPGTFGLVIGLITIALLFATDALDGYLARKYNEESQFGAFYDIVGDRVLETVLLVPFVYLHIAHPILLIYYISKGFVVDYKRLRKFYLSQNVPFKQLQHPIHKFLVSSRFMRALYGGAKLLMISLFYAVIFVKKETLMDAATAVGWLTLTISVLRTYPAFLETEDYSANRDEDRK